MNTAPHGQPAERESHWFEAGKLLIWITRHEVIRQTTSTLGWRISPPTDNLGRSRNNIVCDSAGIV